MTNGAIGIVNKPVANAIIDSIIQQHLIIQTKIFCVLESRLN